MWFVENSRPNEPDLRCLLLQPNKYSYHPIAINFSFRLGGDRQIILIYNVIHKQPREPGSITVAIGRWKSNVSTTFIPDEKDSRLGINLQRLKNRGQDEPSDFYTAAFSFSTSPIFEEQREERANEAIAFARELYLNASEDYIRAFKYDSPHRVFIRTDTLFVTSIKLTSTPT